MAQEMSELTLHIVVKTLFGLEPPDTVRRIGEAFELSNDYITVRDNQPPALRNRFHRWPLPLTRRFRRELAYLDATVYHLISQRRQSGLEGNDLLSLLLNARDEQAENPEDATMTDAQLRDEVITLFAAGHETTAVALTWTWYLLATHPDVQARFHAELDDVLGGRPPTPEDLSRLTFTEQILTESMRLYPPIWSTGRMTFEPIELGGWKIPAGAALAAPQLVLHRDPHWFEDPLEFRPDRWTAQFRAQLPRFVYYPFGWTLRILSVVSGRGCNSVVHGGRGFLDIGVCDRQSKTSGASYEWRLANVITSVASSAFCVKSSSEAVPAFASEKASPGWNPCWCWRCWVNAGRCATNPGAESNWCPWFPSAPRAACPRSWNDAAETTVEKSQSAAPHHSTRVQRLRQHPARLRVDT